MAQPTLITWPYNPDATATVVKHIIDAQPAGTYNLAGSATEQVVDLAEECQVNEVTVYQFNEAVMIARQRQTFQLGENCSIPLELGPGIGG